MPDNSSESPSKVHGTAKHPERGPAHDRPDGMNTAAVAALGKVTEALEAVEHARGLLYGFHRLSGTADLTLQEGVRQLRAAGCEALADEVETTMVGRDVIDGKWTFQIVEAYDAQYWRPFRDTERWLRDQLGAEPHIHEAQMKADEQSGPAA